MPVNFGNGRFSFGPISAVDQGLFENNHDVAFQKLLDWMGNGNPNFGSTTAGRYAQQQQGIWNNRFLAEQSAQTERLAAAKQAWDAQEAARRAAFLQQYGSLDGGGKPKYDPGVYTPPEEQLTWTKWVEQHQGDIGTGFNELTAGQRGANPGAFQIRRNIW